MLQLLGGMLLLSAGTLGVWTFAQAIGEASGLASTSVTRALAATQVVGLLGAWIAAAVGRGSKRGVVLVVSIAVVAVGTLAMGLSHVGWAFLAGLTAVNLGYYCFTPLVYSIGADLDRSGRLAALVGAAGLVGGFVSPFAAGALAGAAERWALLAVVAAAAVAVSAALLVRPAARASSEILAAPPGNATPDGRDGRHPTAA
jgi:MFS family permease